MLGLLDEIAPVLVVGGLLVTGLALIAAGNNMAPQTSRRLVGCAVALAVIGAISRSLSAALSAWPALVGSGLVAASTVGVCASVGAGGGLMYRCRRRRHALVADERRACEDQMYALSAEIYEMLANSRGSSLSVLQREVIERYMQMPAPRAAAVREGRQGRLELQRLRGELAGAWEDSSARGGSD